jgi:hypothetical protein
MSFLRHREIFPSDGGASLAANAPAHRLDEFPAGYSLLAPLLLTIAALCAIRGIIVEPLAAVGRPALKLAFWPAAHHLIWTITGRSE